MSQPIKFDVLIVYNSNVINSPHDLGTDTPFTRGSINEAYNIAYGYFLRRCAVLGLRAALCASADIVGAGTCRGFWTYDNNIWLRNTEPCRAKQIFDRFSPQNENAWAKRQLLFSRSWVRSFNNYSLFKLFFDKQKTYDELADFAIPTVTIPTMSLMAITRAMTKLQQLKAMSSAPHDFTDHIIVKDRFGAGGLNIFKFRTDDYSGILKVLKAHKNTSFIMQPLIRFDRGFKYKNRYVSTDIRLIFLRDKIISYYIRMAKSDDFRCNQHQGGSVAYLRQSTIPDSVLNHARRIDKILNKNGSLYTLDFLVANSGNAYFLEGNTGPGLSWDPENEDDKRESKLLIRNICQELLSRTQLPKVPKGLKQLRIDQISPTRSRYTSSQ